MWFRELTGFEETSGDEVRSKLSIDGEVMTSSVNGRRMACGHLEIPTLAELRSRTSGLVVGRGPSVVRELVGDAGAFHRDPRNSGATFQAASQFNLLEMVSPAVTPEAGIDRYENDPTQGPACAVACGAGTIYRNYFVDLDGQKGQTSRTQIDCLAAVGRHLFPPDLFPPDVGAGGVTGAPWRMQNGYALFDRAALDAVNERLRPMDDDERDAVRAHLRVGVHHRVEVTASTGHRVTQVYCSALPVAYNQQPAAGFEPLARLVLEAAYEATLRVAALTAAGPDNNAGTGHNAGTGNNAGTGHNAGTGNNTVFLTMVGGGVFGNDQAWIIDAIARAVGVVAHAGLDIVIASFRQRNEAVAGLLGTVSAIQGGER